jgi:WhiB family transcriptional regulator, redox-sensing transcriptional regulator
MASDWRHRAACRVEDPEIFFPEGITYLAEAAKRVCATCPVRDECLAWALAHGVTDGIWGGLDEDERRALRRVDVLAVDKLITV